MSKFMIEDLLRTAAGDGGSVPVGPKSPSREIGELFEAWSIECGHNIECDLLLKRSRAAIAHLLTAQTPQSRHEKRLAKDLIRQIDHRLGKRPSNRS